jgi:hypothetical protein
MISPTGKFKRVGCVRIVQVVLCMTQGYFHANPYKKGWYSNLNDQYLKNDPLSKSSYMNISVKRDG